MGTPATLQGTSSESLQGLSDTTPAFSLCWYEGTKRRQASLGGINPNSGLSHSNRSLSPFTHAL